MNIAGSGSIPGGDYQEAIHISGSGTVNGSASCTEFTISGSGKVNGHLHCSGNVKISGSGTIAGDLDAVSATISGGGKVDGAFRSEKCSVSGSFHARSLMATHLHSSGFLKSDKDITAEAAVFHGGVKAGGLINAENLDIVFDASSSADSIGGSFIKIRRKGLITGLWVWLFGKLKNAHFHVNESIEGDEIDIEYVVADTVIGKNLKIGPGCKIGRVVYSVAADISTEAEVGTCEKAL